MSGVDARSVRIVKARSAEQSGIRKINYINYKGGYCYAKNIDQLSYVSQRLR